MKATNALCRILALVLGVAALVLFFVPFATITASEGTLTFNAAQLAWGGGAHGLAKSADILFCMILTVLVVIGAALTFSKKSAKGARWFAPAVALVAAVYMLVVALSKALYFVDTRPLTGVTGIAYTMWTPFISVALFATAIFGIAHLLLDDYITVSESKGGALTIPKRIVRFLRDYKSEVKKIVWPGWKDVAKNTIIVLIICLIIGAVIWLWDFGIGKLLEWLLSLGKAS